jgi:hypothetical protein
MERLMSRTRAFEVLKEMASGAPLVLPWHVRRPGVHGSVLELLLQLAARMHARVVNWPRRPLRARTALGVVRARELAGG